MSHWNRRTQTQTPWNGRAKWTGHDTHDGDSLDYHHQLNERLKQSDKEIPLGTKEQWNDGNYIRDAVKQNGDAFFYASQEKRSDPAFVEEMARIDQRAADHSAVKKRGWKDYLKEAKAREMQTRGEKGI